jgi:hypothetical protein
LYNERLSLVNAISYGKNTNKNLSFITYLIVIFSVILIGNHYFGYAEPMSDNGSANNKTSLDTSRNVDKTDLQKSPSLPPMSNENINTRTQLLQAKDTKGEIQEEKEEQIQGLTNAQENKGTAKNINEDDQKLLDEIIKNIIEQDQKAEEQEAGKESDVQEDAQDIDTKPDDNSADPTSADRVSEVDENDEVALEEEEANGSVGEEEEAPPEEDEEAPPEEDEEAPPEEDEQENDSGNGDDVPMELPFP